jgi:cell division protein FtsL
MRWPRLPSFPGLPSMGPAIVPSERDSFVARAAAPSMVRRAIERRGLARLVAGSLACALLAAVAVFHAWVRTQVTEEGYRLSRLAQEQGRLLDERDRLTRQVAELRTPARMEALAREKLQMGPAPTERVVVLSERSLPKRDRPIPASRGAQSALRQASPAASVARR